MDMHSVKYNNIIVNWEPGTYKPFTSNVGPNYIKKKDKALKAENIPSIKYYIPCWQFLDACNWRCL